MPRDGFLRVENHILCPDVLGVSIHLGFEDACRAGACQRNLSTVSLSHSLSLSLSLSLCPYLCLPLQRRSCLMQTSLCDPCQRRCRSQYLEGVDSSQFGSMCFVGVLACSCAEQLQATCRLVHVQPLKKSRSPAAAGSQSDP